jgi:hypothetical protein
MIRLILAMFLAVSFAGAPKAQTADVQGVISAQIKAFRADDFERAFTYASPTIRGIFGSSERFGLMVRQSFPMVWRPGSVKFLEFRQNVGGADQLVLIRDAAGVFHTLKYEMIEAPEGWKINGVQFIGAPELGA